MYKLLGIFSTPHGAYRAEVFVALSASLTLLKPLLTLSRRHRLRQLGFQRLNHARDGGDRGILRVAHASIAAHHTAAHDADAHYTRPHHTAAYDTAAQHPAAHHTAAVNYPAPRPAHHPTRHHPAADHSVAANAIAAPRVSSTDFAAVRDDRSVHRPAARVQRMVRRRRLVGAEVRERYSLIANPRSHRLTFACSLEVITLNISFEPIVIGTDVHMGPESVTVITPTYNSTIFIVANGAATIDGTLIVDLSGRVYNATYTTLAVVRAGALSGGYETITVSNTPKSYVSLGLHTPSDCDEHARLSLTPADASDTARGRRRLRPHSTPCCYATTATVRSRPDWASGRPWQAAWCLVSRSLQSQRCCCCCVAAS